MLWDCNIPPELITWLKETGNDFQDGWDFTIFEMIDMFSSTIDHGTQTVRQLHVQFQRVFAISMLKNVSCGMSLQYEAMLVHICWVPFVFVGRHGSPDSKLVRS